jgi:hypothetical protein
VARRYHRGIVVGTTIFDVLGTVAAIAASWSAPRSLDVLPI